ncbi:MAG: 4-hydroxy-tetrahydrodipicolinate reductase [Verrucomicrobiota bacterium]|nr:4-hydroxy-tetrahydrodipicolinate reductase [Verrucomicrobiota bacterium]
MSVTNLMIVGAKGRMGQMLIQCAGQDNELKVIKGLDIDNPSFDPEIKQAQAVIEFALHDATTRTLEACLSNKVPLVIGTTGHSKEVLAQIAAAAKLIPIVHASNYSLGMNALFYLVKRAAEILGSDYDQEVIEMHHRMKKDAPSGSALSLAKVLAEVKKQDLEKLTRHGREGMPGERSRDEIGIHALRGGDVVGDHTVMFAGIGERVELTHKASSRETFARGALRAAKWATTQTPGLYEMSDVLGLK